MMGLIRVIGYDDNEMVLFAIRPLREGNLVCRQ